MRNSRIGQEQSSYWAGNGLWLRFSSYEIVERPRGKLQGLYVRPQTNALLETYRPFREYPDVLREYLKLGQAEETMRRSEKEAATGVLTFCNAYGLPGLMWHDAQFFWKNDEFVYSTTQGNDGLVRYKQYAKRFFPDGEEIPSIHDARNPLIPGAAEFAVRYGERVSDIAEYARQLFELKRDWLDFKNSGHSPDDAHPDNPETTWRRYLTADAGNIGMRVRFDEFPRIDYVFSSLLSALDIMFILDVIADTGLRICRECKKLFVPTGPRQRFCHPSHANVFNVRNSRAKSRERESRKHRNTKGE